VKEDWEELAQREGKNNKSRERVGRHRGEDDQVHDKVGHGDVDEEGSARAVEAAGAAKDVDGHGVAEKTWSWSMSMSLFFFTAVFFRYCEIFFMELVQ
jgi:hypothetical protein